MNAPTNQEKRGTPTQENAVRCIIRQAMKGRRHIVATRMSKILDREVTPGMLSDFCRKLPGKRHSRFPAAWVRAFCEAVSSEELARYLLSETDRHTLQIGECNLAAEQQIRKGLELIALANQND